MQLIVREIFALHYYYRYEFLIHFTCFDYFNEGICLYVKI